MCSIRFIFSACAFVVLVFLLPLASTSDDDQVTLTYYSTIKLRNVDSKYHVHSHDVKYGMGSHRQSVTAHGSLDDNGSLWTVFPVSEDYVSSGTPIKCGSTVMFHHLNTGLFLLSEKAYESPLSGGREVAAGESTEMGRHWNVVCLDKTPKSEWIHGARVRFYNPTASCFLVASMNHVYRQPIEGQLEVSCHSDKLGDKSVWTVGHGFFMPVIKQTVSSGDTAENGASVDTYEL